MSDGKTRKKVNSRRRASCVTPAMMRAGAEEIWCSFGDVVPYESGWVLNLAERVFLAMEHLKEDAAPCERR